jgi:toxin-antitoxin system PIN domain toxin
MRALLDVNVLIAVLDSDHLHHGCAQAWLRSNASHGWASCPITQNGCVRVMSLPAYPNPLKTSAVIERLAAAVRHPSHEFWPDDRSLLDPDAVHAERVHGPRQITDLYLLALAVQRDGRLATFDGSVPLSAVPNATKKHLVAL